MLQRIALLCFSLLLGIGAKFVRLGVSFSKLSVDLFGGFVQLALNGTLFGRLLLL